MFLLLSTRNYQSMYHQPVELPPGIVERFLLKLLRFMFLRNKWEPTPQTTTKSWIQPRLKWPISWLRYIERSKYELPRELLKGRSCDIPLDRRYYALDGRDDFRHFLWLFTAVFQSSGTVSTLRMSIPEWKRLRAAEDVLPRLNMYSSDVWEPL